MKKILLLLLFVSFSISVSAHEQTKSFKSQFNTSIATQNTVAPMYSIANGGFIQLIYNVFNKVGHVIYNTMHTDEVPNEEETTSEN